VGLNYICATAERFFAVGAVLGNMVVMLAEQPSPRLLKHIIRCYLRLSDNPRCARSRAAPRPSLRCLTLDVLGLRRRGGAAVGGGRGCRVVRVSRDRRGHYLRTGQQ
jgi:hypothetical protein